LVVYVAAINVPIALLFNKLSSCSRVQKIFY
jgi:hypothetical protein